MFQVRDPQFSSAQFAGAANAAGTAVHVGGKLALLCVPQNPPIRLMLASFDHAHGIFRLSTYHQEDVLTIGNDLVFEPDLSTPTHRAAPGPASTGEAYYNGVGLYVRLRVDHAPNDWPMLDLAASQILMWPPGEQAHVFTRWRLGIKTAQRITWVLAVGAQLEPWASELIP